MASTARASLRAPGSPLFLAVGGIEALKNTRRALAAFAEVRRTMPAAQLAIVGRAKRLLTSFDARPGHDLVMAIDLCGAAKDISMAGAVGTALMLLECSRVGAVIDVDAIPRPPGVPLARWLLSFPSFGFVLGVEPAHTGDVLARFAGRGIAAAVVGRVDDSRRVTLRRGGDEAELWDLRSTPFILPGGPAHA